MGEWASEDYDGYVVHLLGKIVQQLYDIEQLAEEGLTFLANIFQSGVKYSLDEIYLEIASCERFNDTHRYVLAIILGIENKQVSRERMRALICNRTDTLTQEKIVIIDRNDRTRWIPDFLKGLCGTHVKITYPRSAVLNPGIVDSSDLLLSRLVSPCERVDTNIIFISLFCESTIGIGSASQKVAEIVNGWLQYPIAEMKSFDTFLDIVQCICNQSNALEEGARVLTSFACHIPEICSKYGKEMGNYRQAYQTTRVLGMFLDLLGTQKSVFFSILRSETNETGRIPDIYTILYQIAHSGLIVSGYIMDDRLKTARVLILIMKVALRILEDSEIVADVSTIERELVCIVCSARKLLGSEHMKPTFDVNDKIDLESCISRLKMVLNTSEE